MKKGYTKSWRKELSSEIWMMPPIYHRVWFWLRQKTQHETFLFPTRQLFGIWVLAGQRLTSLEDIAEGVKWFENRRESKPDRRVVKRVLDWLAFNNCIELTCHTSGTLVSIINWHTYNSNEDEPVTLSVQGDVQGYVYKKRIIKNLKELKPLVPDALRLSGLLSELILKNLPQFRELAKDKKESTLSRWAEDIDKMNRLDGRTWVEIETMVKWCQADDFWKNNILSGVKLREKYDKMFAKMKAQSPKDAVDTTKPDPNKESRLKTGAAYGL